jgi:hypothetical protein
MHTGQRTTAAKAKPPPEDAAGRGWRMDGARLEEGKSEIKSRCHPKDPHSYSSVAYVRWQAQVMSINAVSLPECHWPERLAHVARSVCSCLCGRLWTRSP